MGKPAARLTDMHVCPMVTGLVPHVGGPISAPGVPTVLIGGLPAAVAGDMCVCVGPPDTIVMGSTGVLIGGKPAARMGDSTAHGGKIVMGLPTVLIGDVGSAQIEPCPCMDAKVAEMSHIEKMGEAIKQSDVPSAILDELGGWGGIAAGLLVAGAVIAAVAAAPVVLAGAVAAATAVVGEAAAVGIGAAVAAGAGLLAEGATAVGIGLTVAQAAKGIGHMADFYNETQSATSCADIQKATKTFEKGAGELGSVGIDALIGKTADIAGNAIKETRAAKRVFAVGEKIAGKTIERIRQGTNGKVAVIGRKMDGHVEDVGKNLKSNKHSVELFNEQSQKFKTFEIDGETHTWKSISDDFNDKGKYLRDDKGWIKNEDLPNTLMYKANQQWAEKLASDGYTVLDIGYPPGVETSSVFYDMEGGVIFGN